ncbi:MAG: hypothetical protein P1U68_13945 [Verrucomicrobiales bacterium]|nr:hypothetical protein [Verrucomicrobiales bacterium]
MSSFRIRPHFVHDESFALEDFQAKIVRSIETNENRCLVKNFPGYLTLVIPDEEQHFWSPQLNLSLDQEETGRLTVRGTYGPNTNVWSMFLYAYLVGGCLAGVSAVFAISKWIVSGSTWMFIPTAAFMLLLAILYLVAQTGQKLGAQQTFLLHQAYEKALGKEITVH